MSDYQHARPGPRPPLRWILAYMKVEPWPEPATVEEAHDQVERQSKVDQWWGQMRWYYDLNPGGWFHHDKDAMRFVLEQGWDDDRLAGVLLAGVTGAEVRENTEQVLASIDLLTALRQGSSDGSQRLVSA